MNLQISSFINKQQFIQVYKQVFENQGQKVEIPSIFYRSYQSLPIGITITISLINLRNRIHYLLKQQQGQQPQQNREDKLSEDLEDIYVAVLLDDDEIFHQQQYQSQNVKEDLNLCLKAASLDIIRYISQLSDSYNDKAFKQSNKSVSSILTQSKLKLTYSEIFSEMRHALTHKNYPDTKLILASIDELLRYLKDNLWDKLLKECQNKDNSVIEERRQLKISLKQIFQKKLQVEDYIEKVDLSDISQKHVAKLYLCYLCDLIIKYSNFHIASKQKTIEKLVRNRQKNQKKLKIVIEMFELMVSKMRNELQKKQNKNQEGLQQIFSECKNLNYLFEKMKMIGFLNETVQQLLDRLNRKDLVKSDKWQCDEKDVKEEIQIEGELHQSFVGQKLNLELNNK